MPISRALRLRAMRSIIAVADTVSSGQAPGVDVISVDADLAAAVLELVAGWDSTLAQGAAP